MIHDPSNQAVHRDRRTPRAGCAHIQATEQPREVNPNLGTGSVDP